MNSQSRSKLGWILAVIFAFALLMGPGPGLQLANSPEPLWGWPRIYLWGLLWFSVEALVILAAYLFVWQKESEN